MSCSTPSHIPHLARAIVEKRQLRSISNRIQYHGSSQQSAAGKIGFSYSRFYASMKSPQRPIPRKAHTTKHVPSPAVPRPAPQQPTTPPSSPNDFEFEPPVAEGQYDPDKDPVKMRRYRQIQFGFFLVVSGFIAYVYRSYQLDIEEYYAKGQVLPQNTDVSSRWQDSTRNFDREVDDTEMVMLLKWKRKRLVQEAYGDVLEVSVGTGRNMEFYDTRPYSATESASYGRDTRHMITSLSFNDESPVMIDNAKKKWKQRQQKRRQEDRFAGNVNWFVGDAGQKGVIPRPEGGYDTIVQSFGICSMADPVKFLQHLRRLVRQPDEPISNSSPKKFREQEQEDGKGGRIFLLEHGRGKYDWLNNFLDKTAPMHADRYGCWYNKDIDKVIEDSGLVIERIRRYHFGTTYEYVLRPAPGLLPEKEETAANEEKLEKATPARGGWLSSLFG